MALLFALISVVPLVFVDCKVYERCELARELKHVHEFPKQQIATWVCIAKHESAFNTSAVNPGSGDHGLFQISELFWCSPPGNGFACNAPCSAFEDDDISDDVSCIKRIFKEHTFLSGNGFNAWVVFPLHCQGDVSEYVEGCFDNEIDNNINHGATHQPEASTSGPDDDGYEFPPLPTPPKKTKSETEQSVEESSLPTTPQSPQTKRSSRKLTSFYQSTSQKPFHILSRNQIATAQKTSRTTFKPFQSFTTRKPLSTTLKTKQTTQKSVNYFNKVSSTLKQFITTKPVRFSTMKPFFARSSLPSYDLYTSFSTSKPKSITSRTTTLKPLSFVYENVHSDHKREQKFYRDDKAEYSFLWKRNGFRLVRN